LQESREISESLPEQKEVVEITPEGLVREIRETGRQTLREAEAVITGGNEEKAMFTQFSWEVNNLVDKTETEVHEIETPGEYDQKAEVDIPTKMLSVLSSRTEPDKRPNILRLGYKLNHLVDTEKAAGLKSEYEEKLSRYLAGERTFGKDMYDFQELHEDMLNHKRAEIINQIYKTQISKIAPHVSQAENSFLFDKIGQQNLSNSEYGRVKDVMLSALSKSDKDLTSSNFYKNWRAKEVVFSNSAQISGFVDQLVQNKEVMPFTLKETASGLLYHGDEENLQKLLELAKYNRENQSDQKKQNYYYEIEEYITTCLQQVKEQQERIAEMNQSVTEKPGDKGPISEPIKELPKIKEKERQEPSTLDSFKVYFNQEVSEAKAKLPTALDILPGEYLLIAKKVISEMELSEIEQERLWKQINEHINTQGVENLLIKDEQNLSEEVTDRLKSKEVKAEIDTKKSHNKEEAGNIESKEIDNLSEEDVIKKYFSYNDILQKDESEISIYPNQRKYVEAFKQAASSENFESLVGSIRKKIDETTRKLGLEQSQWGESQSWIYWDIAKQKYFDSHKDEADPRYDIGDPLEDEKLQQQISDRHLGWEVYGQTAEYVDGQRRFANKNFLNRLNKDDETFEKVITLLKKEPKPENQTLSSYDLAKLGEYIRENLNSAKS